MKYPNVKRVLPLAKISNNRIRIGGIQYGVGSELYDDEEGHVWSLLSLMDGSRSIEQVIQDMLRLHSDLDRDSIDESIQAFIKSGFIEDAGAPVPESLSEKEIERYSRNTNYFAWIDVEPRSSRYEIQAKLKASSVTILGLGGTGSSLAMGLAAAGIGKIHCVDFDVVEESNLTRQMLYTEDDIGKSKVEAAVARLRKMNSYIEITGEERWVESAEDIVPLMKSVDLFALCADKPITGIKEWTSDAAIRTNKPWLLSVYAGPMLVLSITIPFVTPCFRCFVHGEEERKLLRDGPVQPQMFETNPRENAVIAPSASLTGHMGALEAIYFLGGLKPQTIGRWFHQNLMVYDHFYYVDVPFWKDCPACGSPSAANK